MNFIWLFIKLKFLVKALKSRSVEFIKLEFEIVKDSAVYILIVFSVCKGQSI
jgi:hypothetical protein